MAHIDGTFIGNRIFGTSLSDIIHPGAGNDVVYGGGGNDLIDDYAHAFNGSGGDDSFFGGAGADTIYGWTGNDSLDGGTENDFMFGEDGADYMDGWTGSDTLFGGNGNDRLYGYTGNDRLYGASGNDLLYGEDGNDLLSGGLGRDRLYGGNGSDVFQFDSTLESNAAARDVIGAFQFDLDKIDLSAIDADALVAGNQAFKWTDATTGAPARGYLMAVAGPGGETWILGNTDSDSTPEFQLSVVDGTVLPSYWFADDFYL